MSPELEQLRDAVRNSSFNRHKYRVDTSLIDLRATVSFYCEDERPRDDLVWPDVDKVMDYAAEFQRNNDKWTEEMQVKFVENVLKGAPYQLTLACLESEYRRMGYVNCRIIDGLQRLTAIARFLFGAIKPFGYSVEELVEARVVTHMTNVSIAIYRFKNEAETAQFYIEINDGVTHSQADIDRAQKYLEVEVD